MKINKILEQVLYEKKEKKLTIFYKTDVLISETPEEEQEIEQRLQPQPEQTPEQPTPEQTPEQVPQQVPGANEETIYEETFTSKAQGKVLVPEDDVDNIQSLEDLMDYLANKTIKGVPILNDAINEIILNMATGGVQSIADLVHKEDKILISIDYGKDKDNSVGFKALKSSGTATLSLTMKKDNKILPGQFNLQEFNRQLVFFRNSILGS